MRQAARADPLSSNREHSIYFKLPKIIIELLESFYNLSWSLYLKVDIEPRPLNTHYEQ